MAIVVAPVTRESWSPSLILTLQSQEVSPRKLLSQRLETTVPSAAKDGWVSRRGARKMAKIGIIKIKCRNFLVINFILS